MRQEHTELITSHSRAALAPGFVGRSPPRAALEYANMVDVPAAIARLQEFIECTLTGVLVEHRYEPMSCGNMLFDYQLGINRVWIVRDRLLWDFRFSFGGGEWHDLVDIRQALGHGDDLHKLTLDEQVDYAIDHLPMILAHGTRDNRLVDAIQAIRDERFFKMWGRRIPRGGSSDT
jgi:hypothetical protein